MTGMLQAPVSAGGTDRLAVGVAARLSRYLQVLTQAKKMGKDRISSQEIADYTNINATQIRRDLSNFGKFGKRGVGYSIESLLAEIRKILRTQGQHNIALVGAGRLGQAIASSPIFAEHGITIAAVFDADAAKIGQELGLSMIDDERRLKDVVREKNIVVGVLAVPASAAQKVADDLVDAGVRIIFNYSEALLDVPADVTVHTSNPAVELLHALVFPSDVASAGCGSSSGTATCSAEPGRTSTRGRLLGSGAAPGTTWSLSARTVQPDRYDLGGATVVNPELPGRLLPTFVLDRYAGLEPRLLQDCTVAERQAFVEANAAALRELLPADLVFANHVLLGGAVGAAVGGVPFRVKAHGSELEYSMRGRPDLERWGARCSCTPMRRSSAPTTSGACSRRSSATSTAWIEVPPGVDVDEFVFEDRDAALAALVEEARGDPPNAGNAEERLPDDGNAARLAEFFATAAPTVVYFGKLIEQKGVQVLLEAMAHVDARLVVVGFGPYRGTLEALAPPGTLFTGPLEHRHLVHLLPLADVTVVPSIFPEAFGMVAAEAAAAGSPPLVARHSGLAEVAAGLEEALSGAPARARLVRDRRRLRPGREADSILSLSPAEHGSFASRGVRRSSTAGRGRASRSGCSTVSDAFKVPALATLSQDGRGATGFLAGAARAVA